MMPPIAAFIGLIVVPSLIFAWYKSDEAAIPVLDGISLLGWAIISGAGSIAISLAFGWEYQGLAFLACLALLAVYVIIRPERSSLKRSLLKGFVLTADLVFVLSIIVTAIGLLIAAKTDDLLSAGLEYPHLEYAYIFVGLGMLAKILSHFYGHFLAKCPPLRWTDL